MADGIQRSGEQIDAFTEQSITACNNALTIQPDNKYVMQLLTRIFIMKAQWEVELGINANDSLANAITWNKKSSSLENLYSNSWTQASILSIEAKQQLLSGENAQPIIDHALELFNHLLKVESEYKPYVAGDMLYLLALQARDLFRKQQDPTDTYLQAQTLFEEIRLTPDLMVSEQWGLQNNMAQVYMVELWHQFENQQNILPMGEKLLEFLNPSDSVVKDEPHQLITLANTHLLMAEYLRRQQQSPSDHLELAAEYIVQAKKINPNTHSLMITQASLLTLQSYFNYQDYTQANEIFAQVLAANPNSPYNQHAWAESLLIQAQKNQTKSQQVAALKMAHEKLQLALAVDVDNPAFINSQKEVFELAKKIGIELTP
jgi:tetratricopeptide (TPR) repeat protein